MKESRENIFIGMLAVLAIVLAGFFILVSFCGCQWKTHTEYYEALHPDTKEQLIKVKSETSGMLPWSDQKTLSISGVGI